MNLVEQQVITRRAVVKHRGNVVVKFIRVIYRGKLHILEIDINDFVFSGSKESVRRQIGMAVPCEGARVLIEAVLKTFAGIAYDWVEANLDAD